MLNIPTMKNGPEVYIDPSMVNAQRSCFGQAFQCFVDFVSNMSVSSLPSRFGPKELEGLDMQGVPHDPMDGTKVLGVKGMAKAMAETKDDGRDSEARLKWGSGLWPVLARSSVHAS